jgi:hypothetical protein
MSNRIRRPPADRRSVSRAERATTAAGALGLVIFGVYSCCEARWREVEPG